MKVSNKEYSHKELLKRCNPKALYGARRTQLADGRGFGHRLIEVKTTAGFRMTLSESRCLDILEMEYKGVNLGFLSKNGIFESPIANPENPSFLKYWAGGFSATCGLRNAGPDCEIDGEFFPLHGHIGSTPADMVNISVDEKEIIVSGRIRESALFGHCLELERKIIVPSDGSKVKVLDTIHNLTPKEETILLLYHINFGFPFLSEDMKLTFPDGEVRGRTEEAQKRLADHDVIVTPVDGESELVFFHVPTKSDARVVLSNPTLGFKGTVYYDASKLPVLTQWRSMGSGDYALGIEPSTSFIHGRKEELEKGYDIKVPGYGMLEFGFCFDIEDL